ncbi:hypothetical protein [Clostridium hydrogeniformans]|uniref:hypothetical protein n=1 Tax=Clostridium hydrogeniformans TaxID=349933 RepID=UPI000488E70E|nr:hypothetical protein [Clostridium hydrogeniformans]
MAMDKRIKGKINSIMEDKPNITVDELIEIVKKYIAKPDTNKLIQQEYRRITQRLMASYRDEQGVRECFSVKTDTGSLYVNISSTKDKGDLQKIRQQLSKKYRGLNKSLKKIDIREQILNGQIEMNENNWREEEVN